MVVFPVDCISHAAVAAVKRLAQHSDKRYLPLRTSSLTSLLSALMTWWLGPRSERAAE